MKRGVVLGAVVTYGLLVIALQPFFGKLSDRIGRRPLNLFSVIFTALWAFPFFALVQTGEAVLVWIALIVAATVGWAPMIAVQPGFYAELFGARVLYSRETKGIDMEEVDPVQDEIVAATPAEPRELAMNR
jgi:MFS transporter, MHS family, shikimate and dehydroshikimate transport protein